MKKSFLLLISLIVSIVAMGGPLTPDEARQNVAKFMNPRRAAAVTQHPEALKLVSTNHYKINDRELVPSLYVFNVAGGQGYVIAAADDRIPAVLGYSDKGNINPDKMPENMRAWLKSYSDQMEYLNRHPEAAAPRRTVTGGAIEPLLGPIEWDQGTPYNDLCPIDGDVNSLTGCVATAMAQIMYFWKYPATTTDSIPGYITIEKKIPVSTIPAKTPIDWDNMLPQYKGNETDAQKQAVANLMLLCGTSVQMNYTKDFSGAWGGNVATALRAYFDYDPATIFEKHDYIRAAVWNQRVYDELKAGRPVYYDGDSSGSGHAFVVDGYGGDDYFHVNWGWGGASNDYFLLSILDSHNNSGSGATQSSDGYSFGQGAIFGIQPNTGIVPPTNTVLTTTGCDILDSAVVVRSGINQDFVFRIGIAFNNHTQDAYELDLGLGVFNTDGTLYGVIDGPSGLLKPTYGFFDTKDCPFTIALGTNWESMEFIALPIYKFRNTEQWMLPRCSDIYYVHGVFKGDTLRLTQNVFGLTGTLAATGKKEVGSPLTVSAKIANNGSFYLGQIYFVVDGKMVGGRHFDLDPGDSTTVDFSFIPEKTGKSSVSVCTRKMNQEGLYDYTPFITDSITVDSAAAANLTLSHVVENAEGRIVKENVIKMKIRAKNNGTGVYDNNIRIQVYKDRRDGTGYFNLIKETSKGVQIEAGGSVDVDFTFDNLEDNKYLFIYSYLSGGSWKDVKSPVYTVQTREPDPVPVLSTVSQTINAVVQDGNWIVKSDTAYISVKVKNTGKIDYDDNIIVKLYQLTSATGGPFIAQTQTNIKLAVGADTTVVMQFTELQDSATYFYWTYYVADMQQVPGSQNTPLFTVILDKPAPEETGYYLISELNSWSTTDQSYPFTKLDDGKTWQITFNAPKEKDLWLKVAPASAYDDQAGFWAHLFCAPYNGCSEPSGTMIIGDEGAWLLPTTLKAETYTMSIVPSEMTYTITYTEQSDGIQLVNGDRQGLVTIYGLNGNKIAEGNAANLQQQLKSLPKGFYIVRSGKQSAKVRN